MESWIRPFQLQDILPKGAAETRTNRGLSLPPGLSTSHGRLPSPGSSLTATPPATCLQPCLSCFAHTIRLRAWRATTGAPSGLGKPRSSGKIPLTFQRVEDVPFFVSTEKGGRAVAHALTVGQLAHATGVPAKTRRYDEQVGVLPVPRRSATGYRQYAQRDVHRPLGAATGAGAATAADRPP